MVKRLLTLVNRKYGGIHEAAILLGFASIFSQVLGLIRDRALVSMIGPGPILDIYYTSFKVPDLVFSFIAPLVSVTALVPFLVGFKKDDHTIGDEMQTFIIMLLKVFGVFLISVCIVLFVLMPVIVKLFITTDNSDSYTLLVLMSRIMLLSPLFLGIQNIFTSVTQLYKKFFVFAFAPVLYNTGILIGIYVFFPIYGPLGLVYGVVCGALLHLLLQVPVLKGLEFSFFKNWKKPIQWNTIFTIAKISFPRTITLGISTITLFCLTALLIHVSSGSVSLFNFALNVQSIPLMVIGLSYTVASFPLLVELYHSSKEQFFKTATSIGNSIIFWSLPCMTLFIVLRAHIIRVIYGSDSFSWGDTRTTAALFALVTISVVFQSLILLFVRMYYAAGKTKHPLIFSGISFFVTIGISFVGVFYYTYIPYHEYFTDLVLRFSTDSTRPELLFIGVGYVFGYVSNIIALVIGLRRHIGYDCISEYRKVFLSTMLGSIGIGSTTYMVLTILSPYIPLTSVFNVFMHACISGCVGIFVGCIIFSLLKIEPWMELVHTLKKYSFKKVEVIGPNESDL